MYLKSSRSKPFCNIASLAAVRSKKTAKHTFIPGNVRYCLESICLKVDFVCLNEAYSSGKYRSTIAYILFKIIPSRSLITM